MATVNPFMDSLRADNLIDDREIAFVADITCTNGNSGRAWFFLNGDDDFRPAVLPSAFVVFDSGWEHRVSCCSIC